MISEQDEDLCVGLIAKVLAPQRQGLGETRDLYALLQEGGCEVGPGENRG